MLALRELRAWSGQRSYYDVASAAEIRLAKSTVYDALNPNRERMPPLEIVRAIVIACRADLETWTQAWQHLRLREHQRAPLPTRPSISRRDPFLSPPPDLATVLTGPDANGRKPLGGQSEEMARARDDRRIVGNNPPKYDHINLAQAGTLPLARDTRAHVVERGYVVGMRGGGLRQTWVFFKDLEPALIFGRTGRMSAGDITGYGVYEAARETRYDKILGKEMTTLHMAGESLDRRKNEREAYIRWLQGVDLESAQFAPQSRRVEKAV
ncbi:hypothetical protein [Sphaerisporangium siamense]|uniref:XRE family transcriptional regulator n=1 Tax=Sphaerisporangium siamense TaxID=795645 RepID=A0A7W7GCS6_9ACTN|nr:hypothetical protein [Sphaerisporangium siamense]MBB4702281.1 hypothetical protein [Sphaerisporangium siamense]